MKRQAEPSKRFYRATAESLQAEWLQAQDLRVEHLRAMESADVASPTWPTSCRRCTTHG
jgi:hypothetical protein